MKTCTIYVPMEIYYEAQREASAIKHRPDGLKNSVSAVLRDWMIAGKPARIPSRPQPVVTRTLINRFKKANGLNS